MPLPEDSPKTHPGRRRVVVLIVGGVLLLTTAAVAGWWSLRPSWQMEAAEEAFRRHDPAAARESLEEYLARRPGDQRGLLLAARAARLTDAFAEAERYLTEHDRAGGATSESRLEWALLGAQQGDYAAEEVRLLLAAKRGHPEAPDILMAMATGYDLAYRWTDANLLLDRLIEEQPGHVPALLLRGAIAQHLRRHDAAEADFRRAVDATPDSGAAHAALARLLTVTGHTEEAIEHYHAAGVSASSDPASVLGLARAYADAAEPDEGRRLLDGFLTERPGHADVLAERGRLAIRAGEPTEAESFLARAVDAAPHHPEAHELRLLALRELGRAAEASRCEDRIAELTEEEAEVGRLKLRVKNSPGEVAVRWELRELCERTGRSHDSLAWVTEVLSLDPDYPPAHEAFAEHFERAGQPRRAALHRELASAPAGEKARR